MDVAVVDVAVVEPCLPIDDDMHEDDMDYGIVYEDLPWQGVAYLYTGVLEEGTQVFNIDHEIVGEWDGSAVDFGDNIDAIAFHNDCKEEDSDEEEDE